MVYLFFSWRIELLVYIIVYILHSVIIHVKLRIPVCGGKLEDADTELGFSAGSLTLKCDDLSLECEVELSNAL